MPLPTRPQWFEDEIEDSAARGLESHMKNPHFSLARNAQHWQRFIADGMPLAKIQEIMTHSISSHRRNLSNVTSFLARTDSGKGRILARFKGNPNEIEEFAVAYEATIDLMDAAPRSTFQEIEDECNRIIQDTPHVKRRLYG
jgi:hypothetical protein